LFNWVFIRKFKIINSLNKMNKHYPTDLTDIQWNAILAYIDDNRKRKYPLKEILNAIFYLLKTGCQWRMLPKDYPKWELVYYYYCKWRDEGTFEEIHESLRSDTRKRAGKRTSPSLAIIDSQSSKTTRRGGIDRGIDGGKNVKGRKRHIIVDSMGLLLVVIVHAANHHDSKAAFKVIESLKYRFPRLVRIIADAGYRGELADNIKMSFGWILQVVMRKNPKKFEVLPKRWIVERTFSWFESYRRLSKDFEYHTYTQETMVQLAMIKIMLNRIK